MFDYFSTCFQLTESNDVLLKLFLILALIAYIILLSKTNHNKKIIIIKTTSKEAKNYINEKIETKAKILHVYIIENFYFVFLFILFKLSN